MTGVKFGFRAVAVCVLAAGSWLACSTADHPEIAESSVTVTRQALDPGWTPGSLSPVAWYVAASSNVTLDAAGISEWRDISGHQNHVAQANDYGKPHLNTTGWASSQPTVTFDGSDFLHLDIWSATPAGTNTPLAVLAVIRPSVTADAEVVGWWDPNGGGTAWAGIKMADGRALPDLGRTFSLSYTAAYSGVHDLGTGPHVVAWRYLPASQTIKLTVDGATSPPSNTLAPIGPLPQLPLLIGAGSLLPTRLYHGDISELVIVASSLDDNDIQNFTDYARLQWNGLPTQGSTDPCVDASGNATPSTVRCDDNNDATYGDHCSNRICAGTVPPPGNPTELSATAWYHAGAPEVAMRDNGVETWFDRTTHHVDVTNGFYFSRPTLAPDGWSTGKPTLGFAGHHMLLRDAWTGNPDGADADFTVLAVLQPTAAQSAGVSAWGSQVGGGRIACDLKTSGGATSLDLFRIDISNVTQDFTGSTDLGTSKHVVAWRYSPGRMQLSIDGTNVPNPGMTAIGPVNPETFLIGEDSVFTNTLLNANIAELAVIPRSINDAELARYASYAQAEWGGLTLCAPNCTAGCGGDGCGGTCDCNTPCTTSAECSVGLECVSGVCVAPGGGGPGSRCTTDTDCSVGLHCASGECGGLGAVCSATCAPGLSCSGGTCVACTASCDGKIPGQDNGCGVKCQGDVGADGCSVNSDCRSGLVCVQERCVQPDCDNSPALYGCGYPGAPCGDHCTTNPLCQTTDDCPQGLVCGVDNGWRYGLALGNVCEDARCPALDCGTIHSTCGLCDCTPSCDGKTCGDADLSNGCNGRCKAVCETGQSGCQLDTDCQPGDICLSGTCRPGKCSHPDLAPPDCGGPGAVCGTCPAKPVIACSNRECGADPTSGASCGSCGFGQFCSNAGHCAGLDHTPVISVVDANGASRPIVPLASPPAASVGTIAGSFSVSDRGSAIYAIPIELPPGRGVEPAIALRYSSSTGNGPLGLGWSIEGLSMISRCIRTYAQDALAAPITGTDADALCLDGQRLKQTGTLEYHTAVDTFALVKGIDSDPSTPEPESFVAYTKDGRIIEFGATDDSRLMLDSSTVRSWAVDRISDRAGNFMTINYRNTLSADLSTGEAGTAELLPDTIEYSGHGSSHGDRELTFVYDDGGRGDVVRGARPGGGRLALTHLVKSIDVRAQGALLRRYTPTYGSSSGLTSMTSLQECAGPTAAICKPATSFEYIDDGGGFNDPIDLGDNPIDIPVNGPVPPDIVPYGTTTKDPSGRDRLTVAVVQSSAQLTTPIPAGVDVGVSMIPYAGPILAIGIDVINWLGSSEDVSYLYRDYSFVPGPGYPRAVETWPCVGEASPRRHVIVDSSYGYEGLYDQCPTSWLFLRVTPPEWFIDIDGDGIQDKVFCRPDAPNEIDYALAGSSRTVPINATHAQRTGETQAFGTVCNLSPPFSTAFDVNGDGTTDLVAYDQTLGWAALTLDSDGPHWHPEWFSGVDIEANSKYGVYVLDANGDGLKDILALPAHVGGALANFPLLALNTGHGFREQLISAADGVGRQPTLPTYVVDVDHDGKDELLVSTSTEAKPWQAWKVVNNELIGEDIPSLVAGPGVVGDFNGDGSLDVFSRSLSPAFSGDTLPGLSVRSDLIAGINMATPKHRNHFLLHYGKGTQNRLLQAVTDGVGKRIDVTYAAPGTSDVLGNDTLQFPLIAGDSCHWPTRCLSRVDQPLVSSYAASHYLDQAHTAKVTDGQMVYNYGNPRGDAAGYGWLGFEQRTITELDPNLQVVKTTTLDYERAPTRDPDVSSVPYEHVTTGLLLSSKEQYAQVDSQLTGSNETLIVTTTNTWDVETSSAGQPFAFLSARSTVTSNRSGSVVTDLFERNESFSPDEYGNVVSATETSGDYPEAPLFGSQTSSQMTRVYDHSQTNLDAWLVGLVQDDFVTSTPRCTDSDGCAGHAQTRHLSYEYYPGTDLTHVITREKDSGIVALERRTTLTRDDFGNVTDARDEDLVNNVREHGTVYDDRGMFPINEIEIGEGKQLSWQVRYDDRFGQVVAVVDPNGIDQTFSYDEFGMQRIQLGPAGHEQIDYYPDDLHSTSNGVSIPAVYSVRVEKIGGDVSTIEYDNFGKALRTSTTGFSNETVFQEMTYDERQRLAQEWRPHLDGDASQSYVSYQYDNMDRRVLETYPNGLSIEHQFASISSLDAATLEDFFTDATFFRSLGYGWNIQGAVGPIFIEKSIDRQNLHVTGAVIDRDGRTTAVRDSSGLWAEYLYGAFGQLDEVGAVENVVSFQHDAYGRLLQTDDYARGGPENVDYDALDEPVEADNAAHSRHVFYDDFGRLKRIEEDDSTAATYTYDGTGPNELGRLVETTSSTGQRTTYGYEPSFGAANRGLLNRVTRYLTGFHTGDTERALETHYQFDSYSRLNRVDYPEVSANERLSVQYTFDNYGHMTSAFNAENPGEVYWQFVDADEGYRVKRERVGSANCEGGGTAGVVTEYGYDASTGQQTSIQSHCGAAAVQLLSYGYDPEGKLTSRGDEIAAVSEDFGYDDGDHLHTVNGVDTYDYYGNPPGELQAQLGIGTYVYDLKWLRTAGSYSFEHDAVGNISSRSGPAVPGEREDIQYTQFDLPRTITDGNVVETAFGYDSDNARVVKENSVGKTTFYAGDLYQRTEDSGSTLHRHMIFVGGRAVAQVTQADSGARTVRSLHQDLLGSTQAVTGADGTRESTFSYTPFGRATVDGTGSDVIYQFTGQENDEDLGLTNMHGRMYDPIVGQFLSADPSMAGVHGALSRYAYVDSSPLNYTDPSGFNKCALGISCQGYAVGVTTAIAAAPAIAGAVLAWNPAQGGAVAAQATQAAVGGGDAVASGGGLGNTLGNVASTGGFNFGSGAVDLVWHGINQNLPVTRSSGAVTSRGSATAGGGVASPTHTAPVDFAHTVPERVQEGATQTVSQVVDHRGAQCGIPGAPGCGSRSFGSSPMDKLIPEFLDRTSPDATLQGMTVRESITALSAPEHAAHIIRMPGGGYRLGPTMTSGADWGTVDVPGPELAKGEQYVGLMHTHPNPPTAPLAQSQMDLTAANNWANARGSNFATSYVIGPSGKGPYLGVIEFRPKPSPGMLNTLLP